MLLATLLIGSDGHGAMPVVIVAVIVAFVISAWFVPHLAPESAEDASNSTPDPAGVPIDPSSPA